MDAIEGAEGRGGLASAWRTITLIVMGVLGVGVLVALIITLGEANKQRNRAISLQSHSYDVMILSRALSGTIARSEASLGRYVISGDKQLGRLYYEDWRRAGDQIKRLGTLTRDNPEQAPRIERLRSAYDTRGKQLSLTALSTNYGKNDQALSRYYQARNSASLDEINRVLDEIIDGERLLLDRRTSAAMTLVDRSTRAAFVLSAFGVLLLLGAIALGWLTVRALTERAMARTEANAQRARAEELAAAVAAATEELRAQEARLRQVQKMDAVGQLTGGIAHDFNNMLAVVIGGLELARRAHAGTQTGNGTDVARHLASASEGAMRAAELTRRLLAFAREEAINPEPIAIGNLIDGMRDLLDRTLGDGIQVVIVDHAAQACVRADRVQLENSLLNLAVNARDAMDGRGTMTITAGCDAEMVTIAVADSGCGMTPEVAERVFEPFFTTKPVGKGTGLGLSQIFAFVRQQDGEVAIDTAPGDGTTVRVRLPRVDAGVARVITQEPLPTIDGDNAARVILVVEDDPRVLAATVGALEELGHEAIACSDPLAAPDLLDEHAGIDLIVSDVLMPLQTGPEMIAALDPRHAHIAVLFVTGFAGESGEFGGHPVLRKPFTLIGLEKAVAEALARRRHDAPHRIAAE